MLPHYWGNARVACTRQPDKSARALLIGSSHNTPPPGPPCPNLPAFGGPISKLGVNEATQQGTLNHGTYTRPKTIQTVCTVRCAG